MASSSSSSSEANLVPLCIDSSTDEYNSWKETVLSILERRNLLGIIDGGIPLPPETNRQAYDDWRRIDRQIRNWILGQVSNEVAHHAVAFDTDTARSVWIQLENWFTQSNGSATPPPAALRGEDWNKYLPLYKAALRGDWGRAQSIFDQDSNAVTARVASTLNTALHVAVGTGKAIQFVEKLVQKMSDESLALKNELGHNALHTAALIGNVAAARILVKRNPDLLYVPSNWGVFPIVNAAMSAHRGTIEFLISVTRDDLEPNPYADDNGVLLVTTLVDSGFFDIALHLIDKYHDLAKVKHSSGHSALRTIALKDTAFASGARFNFWERLIYTQFQRRHRVLQNVHSTLFEVIKQLVPQAKRIQDQIMMHHQALNLVKCLCQHMESLSDKDAASIYRDAMFKAAELGIHEVIEVIVETFPVAIYSLDASTKKYLFHTAVENRCEKVFNLVYQMSDNKHLFSGIKDSSGNTALHLVASLAPHHKLNLVSGAALQMQRELQWFKEVEKFVRPYERGRPNNAGKTPKMIFTEEHMSLKIEGEKWMKDTANSCSIAAALIATVVFAAAITVLGGNADTGYPLFSKSSAFIVFAAFDAISLFTSATSLLMFLSILTSRYAEEDFLYALPKRLCVGLLTLFVSILSMMAAFSATLYLVFGQKNAWVVTPVAALACLPVTSFVLLQFPLLVDVISSTYGPGIFGKQSDRPFY